MAPGADSVAGERGGRDVERAAGVVVDAIVEAGLAVLLTRPGTEPGAVVVAWSAVVEWS